jgi:hypothetical protein
MTENLAATTDLDLAAIEQLAVDCAQACADVTTLRAENETLLIKNAQLETVYVASRRMIERLLTSLKAMDDGE